MVLVYLPLAAPIGLSSLHNLTLCGSVRALFCFVCVKGAPGWLVLFDYSRVGRPRDRLLPVPLTKCIQMHRPSDLCAPVCADAGSFS